MVRHRRECGIKRAVGKRQIRYVALDELDSIGHPLLPVKLVYLRLGVDCVHRTDVWRNVVNIKSGTAPEISYDTSPTGSNAPISSSADTQR